MILTNDDYISLAAQCAVGDSGRIDRNGESVYISADIFVDYDMEKELKNLSKGRMSKDEVKGVERIIMASKPDDGVTGESTLWKLVQGITAQARELEPRRQRDLQEIAGDLMNRVKIK